MKISVIIPCHNAGPFIERTLKSVAAQTLTPHEVIVVDDDSTDDSVQRIKSSGIGVEMLRVAHHNAAATRNAGIAIATGDWIALQDSQDIWYPQHLELAAEMLRQGDAIAYDAGVDDLFDDETIHRRAPISLGDQYPPYGIPGETYFASVGAFSHITMIARRDRLVEVGGYDPQLVRRHDIDLWMRLITGHRFAYRPQSMAAARQDFASGLSQNTLSCNEYLLKALRKNERAFADSPAYHRWRSKTARDTVSIALTAGAGAHARREALRTAWPDLSPGWRRLARILSWQPRLGSLMIRGYRGLRRATARLTLQG